MCKSEPKTGDIVLSPTGRLGTGTPLCYWYEKHIGVFKNDEEALEEARELRNDGNFFPNVWIESNHGNFHLVEDL